MGFSKGGVVYQFVSWVTTSWRSLMYLYCTCKYPIHSWDL